MTTPDADSGSYGALFTIPIPPLGSAYVIVHQELYGFQVGATYRFGVWYKLTGNTGQAYLFANSATGTLQVYTLNLPPATTWTYAEITAEPLPAGTTRLLLDFGGTGGYTLTLDDVVVG